MIAAPLVCGSPCGLLFTFMPEPYRKARANCAGLLCLPCVELRKCKEYVGLQRKVRRLARLRTYLYVRRNHT